MGIEISLNNTKISGKARVLSNTSIRGGENNDVRLKLHDIEISEQAALLENLEINSVLEELNEKAQRMDKNANEYYGIQEILKVKQWDRNSFARCITKHLGEFSQGVLASVVANFFTSL